jgi:tRNA A-37 threonylcarbamoyl transferase component Bud32
MSSRVCEAETTDFRDQPIPSMLPNCVILETPAATLWCDPLIPMPVRKSIAKDPHRFIRSAAAMPVKISRETLVLQAELPLDGQTLLAAIKQYRPHTVWKAAAAMVRRPKAMQNWAKAEFLAARDIATPRPVLACLTRDWASFRGSFLVTQWVDGGENLHLFGWRLAKRRSIERLRIAAACAESLGRLIGRMHAAGAAHRDLKAANLLVVEKDAGLETWLVDLDGLQVGRQVSLTRRARDIARLAAGLAAHPWVTRSICLRFLRAYVGAFPGIEIAWKPLWRAIAARAAQIVARKQKYREEVL